MSLFLDIPVNKKHARASSLTSEANKAVCFTNAGKQGCNICGLQSRNSEQEVEKDRGGQCLQINHAYQLIKNQSLREYKQSELGISQLQYSNVASVCNSMSTERKLAGEWKKE